MKLNTSFTDSNETNFSHCKPLLLLTSFSNVSINVTRFTLTALLTIWLIIVILTKEFHSRKMVFMHNLNFIGLCNCATGISFLFYSTCTVLDEVTCAIQSCLVIFASTISGYGIAALAIYRLYLMFSFSINVKLSFKTISISIVLIWGLPIIFTTLQIFAFKTKFYYLPVYNFCKINAKDDYSAYFFYIIVHITLPNLIIISCYIVLFKTSKNKIGSLHSSSRRLVPKMKIQVIIYILIFECNCIANLFIYHQTIFLHPIVSDEILALLRVVRWLHLLHPLYIFYSHPILIKNYKKLLSKICLFYQLN